MCGEQVYGSGLLLSHLLPLGIGYKFLASSALVAVGYHVDRGSPQRGMIEPAGGLAIIGRYGAKCALVLLPNLACGCSLIEPPRPIGYLV